ncbi:hypothetical protein DET49_11726 [Salegentibacter sp. 24]|uniref:hypothetical protein n=1 Tax=Salegentibacter sp. 24 TaxID=2183986 RepID=UPI00105D406A|nr:hypothetical protein [Salegentibacter sp. 24]TDN85229.1 hypothetical protein DET49_11726 [Salegentibacter sp. 24]
MKLIGKILMTLGVLLGSFILIGFTFEQEDTLNTPPKFFALVLGLGTIASIFAIWRKEKSSTGKENNPDF